MAATCSQGISSAPVLSLDRRPVKPGSLLELTAGGKVPINVGADELRTFFEDGDVVVVRGWCERVGAR